VTDHVNQQSARLGLVINVDKTKTMAVGDEQMKMHIQINGKELEQVKEFVYLGGVISDDGRSIADIRRRIGLTYSINSEMSGTVVVCLRQPKRKCLKH